MINSLPFIPGRGSNNQTDTDGAANTTSKKVSSICFNMPAVGLGARPPSIISTSTDEGGFNEPSPEVKAKLKPAYTFELDSSVAEVPQHHPLDVQDLHYVDVSHRLNPDGSEGENSYVEPDMYSIKNSIGLGGDRSEKVVYATIKPEVPPAAELFEHEGDSEQRMYHSPQSILDPTRPSLLLSNGGSRQDSIEDKRLPDLPIEPPPPPRPPLPKLPPLDVGGEVVEYVDDCDEDMVLTRNGVVALDAVRETVTPTRAQELAATPTSIPESMTADEAERLLSSR